MGENAGDQFKPSVVGKKLLQLGLPRSPKAFAAAITGALNRCIKKGLAEKGKDEYGRNVYWFTKD